MCVGGGGGGQERSGTQTTFWYFFIFEPFPNLMVRCGPMNCLIKGSNFLYSMP